MMIPENMKIKFFEAKVGSRHMNDLQAEVNDFLDGIQPISVQSGYNGQGDVLITIIYIPKEEKKNASNCCAKERTGNGQPSQGKSEEGSGECSEKA